MAQQQSDLGIVYSCYHQVSRGGEQFIQDHVFSYHISGTLLVNDGNKEHHFEPGDFRFVKRNQLAKFLKQPPEGGDAVGDRFFRHRQFLAIPDIARESGTAGCFEVPGLAGRVVGELDEHMQRRSRQRHV